MRAGWASIWTNRAPAGSFSCPRAGAPAARATPRAKATKVRGGKRVIIGIVSPRGKEIRMENFSRGRGGPPGFTRGGVTPAARLTPPSTGLRLGARGERDGDEFLEHLAGGGVAEAD